MRRGKISTLTGILNMLTPTFMDVFEGFKTSNVVEIAKKKKRIVSGT